MVYIHSGVTMIDIVYPRRIRESFTGRSYFLNLLDKNLEKIKSGSGKNILLLGQKFIGKSTILKEFMTKVKDADCCYIDFEKIDMSPERFSVEFVGEICYWLLSKKYDDFQKFHDIETLKRIAGDLKSESAARIIRDIDNELAKIKTDQGFLIKNAFNFPQVLSKESGKKIIICAKEFQSIFSLENYEGIKDAVSVFDESSGYVNYIATSSEISSAKERLGKSFVLEEVSYMSKDEISELIKNSGKKADINLVYKLAKGHPLYSLSILDGDVEKNFVRETLSKKGIIYNSCSRIFHESLYNARGQTLLKIILKILAKEDGLRLSEISKRLYRSSPVTKNLLARLMDVDLVRLDDKKFSFSDPVLRYWAKNIFNGIEFDDEIDEKILAKLVKELE
jgi:uncharacterized protein